jgi:hypothetical protein
MAYRLQCTGLESSVGRSIYLASKLPQTQHTALQSLRILAGDAVGCA